MSPEQHIHRIQLFQVHRMSAKMGDQRQHMDRIQAVHGWGHQMNVATDRHRHRLNRDLSIDQREMENFRSLFSPYGASKKNLSRPPPAKKAKKGPFQVKETWTHEFFCLASTTVTAFHLAWKKLKLQDAGLGRRKIVFSCKASAFEVQSILENIYPKLSETGGFDLLRSGCPCTSLITIHPAVTGGYSVPFLHDSAGPRTGIGLH